MRKIDLNNFRSATSETARDINSRIMLNLVRKHQPVSRADLMRHSGLKRSTISVITDQLISKNWLQEGAVGQSPRGRRPVFLYLNENRAGVFGINIQPFPTDTGLADLNGHLVAQKTVRTPKSPEALISQLNRHIVELKERHPMMVYEGIGVSLPGRVGMPSQKFIFAPNLGWQAADLKARLQEVTGFPVSMENAANACALSEFWFGRHPEGTRNLAVVTVSEGIGVGMILNNQLVRGRSGLAGEFGHVSLDENGLRCSCGNRGCWEVYASNSAAIRYYNESVDCRSHVNTFKRLLTMVHGGNPQARRALKQMVEYLAKGLAMLIAGLAPEIIVVVGEITDVWDKIIPIIAEITRQCVSTHSELKIAPSEKISQPRLRGAVVLVLQKYFSAPAFA